MLELRVAGATREVPAELAELVVAIAPLEPRLAHPPMPLLDSVAHREVGRRDDPRPGVVEHQRHHALRVRGREHGAELAPGRPRAEQGGALGAGVVHDGADVVHAGLEARQVPGPVGETRAALIEQDQPGEVGEPPAELDEDGLLPGPHQIDHERHEDQIDRPLTHDLVGDADIGGARVAHLGRFQVHGAED